MDAEQKNKDENRNENDKENVAGSYASKKWFKSEKDEQKHVYQLRYNEKLVNGLYVEDPDLSLHNDDDYYLYPND
jgi:hypothetical protein